MPPALADLYALCLSSLPPVLPQTLWSAWTLAPQTLLPLLLALALPLALRRAGLPLSRGEGGTLLLGWGLLALALVSPLCRLSATLASAHMLQHLILIVAAPLVLAIGLRPALAAARLGPALGGGGAVSGATVLLAAVIWLGHAPPVYEAALLDAGLHLLLLAATLGAALLFWVVALSAPALRGFGMVFTTMLHSGMLGALLTFASTPWYPVFGAGPAAWGLTALEDQQLAGLIMWVPMGLALLAAALWIGGSGLARELAAARSQSPGPSAGPSAGA